MTQNNNFSVLPWYESLEQQNARKWWINGKVYPLFTPAGYFLPFQIAVPHNEAVQFLSCNLYTKDGIFVEDIMAKMIEAGLTQKTYNDRDYSIIIFPGSFPALTSLLNGQYYMAMEIDAGDTGIIWRYSEVFTVVNDMSGYLKLEWWDIQDFEMDAGVIVYKFDNDTQFKNVLYLCADIAKPEYPFDEEVIERDGYTFPVKQISEKRYKFSFLASEYLLDVMRFIRMADYARIVKNGITYKLDNFLITPEWEDNGDVASVDAEFDTATVAKKIGRGYIETDNGDFNNDYNEDYFNEIN